MLYVRDPAENVKSSEEISMPIDFSESKILKSDSVLWMRPGRGATWIELQFGILYLYATYVAKGISLIRHMYIALHLLQF